MPLLRVFRSKLRGKTSAFCLLLFLHLCLHSWLCNISLFPPPRFLNPSRAEQRCDSQRFIYHCVPREDMFHPAGRVAVPDRLQSVSGLNSGARGRENGGERERERQKMRESLLYLHLQHETYQAAVFDMLYWYEKYRFLDRMKPQNVSWKLSLALMRYGQVTAVGNCPPQKKWQKTCLGFNFE